MKKTIVLLCVLSLFILLTQGKTYAQLSGTKTIPGTYATIAAAITDLNTQGVGSGGVTFNIAVGYTETIPAGGFVINIASNPPNASNPVVFQRSGTGVNPILNSDVSGSGLISGTSVGVNGDAFVKFVGTDYITFNNINLTENYTGAATIQRMEYGFLLVRASSTDGCQNVTINGCVINMQRINLVSCGISSLNINASGTTTSPTTTDGRHENLSVQGSTVNNSLIGMYFSGYASSSPYDLYDHFYKIGTTTGNTLSNIGSGGGAVTTATLYGIYALYQDSIRILNNTINVSTGLNNQTHYGIFMSTGTNSSVDITNNTVADTADGTVASSSQQAGIYNSMGSTGTDNTVNITNNKVMNCRYFNASSPTVYYLYNSASAFTVNITGNYVDSNSLGGQSFSTATGTQYGLYYSATNSTTGSVTNISGNFVRNMTRTQSAISSGTVYGMYLSSGGRTYNVYNNTLKNLYNSTTGTLAGIYSFPSAYEFNIYNNTVSDLTKLEGTTSAAIYGLYWSQSTPIQSCYNNNVFNITNASSLATGVIYGIYNFGSPPNVGGYESIYGNTVHDVSHQGTTVSTGLFFVGIYDGAGTTGGCDKTIHDNSVYNVTTNYGQTGGMYLNYADTAYIYNNRIYNITNTMGVGNTPQVYGMLMQNSVATSVYNVYNNYISELYANASPTFPGMMAIWQNGGAAGNYFYNTIYLDGTSSGSGFGTMGMYLVTTATSHYLKNNIIINRVRYTGTGGTICLYRSVPSLANFEILTNNNNYYAGTPSDPNNILYFDGTSAITDISAYKTYMAPREIETFSESSPFMDTTSHPYNLHMKTTVPTYCESGGVPITAPFAITTDYDGNTRNATTPDVGADEFAGIHPQPPAPPQLISPTNGATNQPLSLNLVWNSSASATSYHLQLSTNSGFSSFVVNDSTLTDTLEAVSGLSQVTTYYWRVKAKNDVGPSTFSSTWNFTTQSLIPSIDLKVYLEGFWNGTTHVQDTARIYLANSSTYAFVDSSKVVLSSTGTASTDFPNATGGSYYIVVKHRNHLETWSKLPQTFVGGTPLGYDFTTAGTQAYGDNMKQVGSVWVLYGGDPNQDGSIDALDISIFVGQFGQQGYLSCDFNGDDDVNALDVQIIAANFGLTKAMPSTLMSEPVIKKREQITPDMKKEKQNKIQIR